MLSRPNRVNERKLLVRIAGSDEVALRQLYDLYYPRLGRFLLRITRDREVAAEVINDVFLVVWRKACEFRGDSSPSTWIMGIAYKTALKAVRRLRSFESLDVVSEQMTDDKVHARDELHASLAKLSPKHQAVIILTYEFGYSPL